MPPPPHPTQTGAGGSDAIHALTDFGIGIEGVSAKFLRDVSVQQVTLTESLLTPSLATSVTLQDTIHTNPVKVLDEFAMKNMALTIQRPVLEAYGIDPTLEVNQQIYRLEKRRPHNYGVEQYVIQACDPSLLNDARKRVSYSWPAATPDTVVKDVLTKCLKVDVAPEIESSDPPRTYFANNIHPFQVIAQQADVALAEGNDPSFIHYMTYEQWGTHKFKSLKKLTQEAVVFECEYTEKGAGAGYVSPHNIISYEFPCDFDALSDILNGVDPVTGQSINSSIIQHPYSGTRVVYGDATLDCGMGGANVRDAHTNIGTGPAAGTQETGVEKYLHLRQARISLLNQDKIALRITLPFNPTLHVGQMIKCTFWNKTPQENFSGAMQLLDDYGTGDYLIATMTHVLKAGGFGITVLDLVSKTVGIGVV
jgi:hypothetical protein